MQPAGQDPEAHLAPGMVTVPLCSRPNASPFWIMLLLVSGGTGDSDRKQRLSEVAGFYRSPAQVIPGMPKGYKANGSSFCAGRLPRLIWWRLLRVLKIALGCSAFPLSRCPQPRSARAFLILAAENCAAHRSNRVVTRSPRRRARADATAHLALQHHYLMSKRGIHCFKSAIRFERRGQQRGKEAE
jgi:hypothetical protein